MTIDEIIKLARKAGGYDGHTSPPTDWGEGDFVISPEELSKFAALVRAAALEEAAGVCEDLDEEASWKEGRLASGHECAAAIRAMKEQT